MGKVCLEWRGVSWVFYVCLFQCVRTRSSWNLAAHIQLSHPLDSVVVFLSGVLLTLRSFPLNFMRNCRRGLLRNFIWRTQPRLGNKWLQTFVQKNGYLVQYGAAPMFISSVSVISYNHCWKWCLGWDSVVRAGNLDWLASRQGFSRLDFKSNLKCLQSTKGPRLLPDLCPVFRQNLWAHMLPQQC